MKTITPRKTMSPEARAAIGAAKKAWWAERRKSGNAHMLTPERIKLAAAMRREASTRSGKHDESDPTKLLAMITRLLGVLPYCPCCGRHRGNQQ